MPIFSDQYVHAVNAVQPVMGSETVSESQPDQRLSAIQNILVQLSWLRDRYVHRVARMHVAATKIWMTRRA